MLTSYSRYIGTATTNSVNASAVGVMMAAAMQMTTIAWRRYVLRKSALMNPNRAKIQHKIGSSNISPINRQSVSNVAMYDVSEM